MTAPRPAQWKDPVVDDLLAGVTVAPFDRYAAATVPFDRYANTAPFDRYASTTFDRYAQTVPFDRYAQTVPFDRYAQTVPFDRYAQQADVGKPGKQKFNHVLLFNLPPLLSPSADPVLWLPMCDYAREQEGYDLSNYWRCGEGPDFTDLTEYLKDSCDGWDCDEEDHRHGVVTVEVDGEEETFQACDCSDNGEYDLPMTEARAVREELAPYPDLVAGELDPNDLSTISWWAGLPQLPTQTQVAAAVAADPTSGLGGAALDYTVWLKSEHFGQNGWELDEILQQLIRDYEVFLGPLESFLLRPGSLRPGTVGRPGGRDPSRKVYLMTGEYQVNRISYHSNLTGTSAIGWRSDWLEPYQDSAPVEEPRLW